MQHVLCQFVAADTTNLFYLPVKFDSLPNYRRLAERPLSIATISAFVSATTTTSTVVANSKNHLPNTTSNATTPSYTWQLFEDDLVTMLLNCIAYNKIGSTFYGQATKLLGDLPLMFSRASQKGNTEGYSYSRTYETSSPSNSISALATLKRAASNNANKISFGDTASGPSAALSTTATTRSVAPFVVGGKHAQITEKQLQHEALMLHFTALLAKELAGALTSVLLSTPVKATPSALQAAQSDAAVAHGDDPTVSSTGYKIVAISNTEKGFTFASPAHHLVPKTVEELRQRVISHTFPHLGAFLRTVSMMLSFAAACTTDEEAVDILVKFQSKINQQSTLWSVSNSEDSTTSVLSRKAEAVINEARQSGSNLTTSSACATTISDTISNHTKTKILPPCCEELINFAENSAAVKKAIANNVSTISHTSSPTVADSGVAGLTPHIASPIHKPQPPPPSSAVGNDVVTSYEKSLLNNADRTLRAAALALISSLASSDTTAAFQHPFLLSEYVSMVQAPCDFYTMKLKAVLGLYTLPFVGRLANNSASPIQNNGALDKVNEAESDNANIVKSTPASEEEAKPLISQDSQEIDYNILDGVRASIRADVDRMVDNCTFYNGPDHQLSRQVAEIRRAFASEARKCGL